MRRTSGGPDYCCPGAGAGSASAQEVAERGAILDRDLLSPTATRTTSCPGHQIRLRHHALIWPAEARAPTKATGFSPIRRRSAIADKYHFTPDAAWLAIICAVRRSASAARRARSSPRMGWSSPIAMSAKANFTRSVQQSTITRRTASTRRRLARRTAVPADSRCSSCRTRATSPPASPPRSSRAPRRRKPRPAQGVEAAIEKEAFDRTGLVSEVITLFGGARYDLYQYKKYPDVRLVFRPMRQTAAFGGDTDNFEFPRFDLDICLFRIYDHGTAAPELVRLPASSIPPARRKTSSFSSREIPAHRSGW